MNKPSLSTLLEKRILVLDGAMGTMIQRHQLGEADFQGDEFLNHPVSIKGNNDLLSITQPEIIAEIHRSYLEAGADIIETNTFSGTTIAQEDYQCEHWVDQINEQSAKIAKAEADRFTLKIHRNRDTLLDQLARLIKQPPYHQMLRILDFGLSHLTN
jgi:5-methyltetrahydrofolate--homocysteine methyltransferase